MSELVTAIPTGIAAFTATNLDDLVILTLLFSQVNATFRRRHIVVGQYLGFTALVCVSLAGFFGSLVLPSHLIGLLGLVPIALGLNQWLNQDSDSSPEAQLEPESPQASAWSSLLSPQTYSVSAITVANGSDNIGIYVPLFANSSQESLLIMIAVFLSMVGVWCYVTYKLTRQLAIATVLNRYGNSFVPFVLIGLGVFIVLKSASLTPIALVGSCLCLAVLVKQHEPDGESPETEEH
ncbi:MAG: cadmium resistance transporter [Chroococcidiopsidaceae cyanobacterium CP_BM_ER_R8_30]|nr:cadmium resistance transporter [Chroococcidiopsidaceae cyanobacterium CP_BM_ER_R8_30]